MNDKRQKAAQTLHRAADLVRDQSHRLPRSQQRLTHVADRINAVAGYAESHDATAMRHDLEALVKRHPAEAITAALFLGIVVGRSIRNTNTTY